MNFLLFIFLIQLAERQEFQNYFSFFLTLSYITLFILEQDSDQEEEVFDHDEEEHRHNYAENPSTLNRNTLIGKKLFEIYEKDPRPSVKRKKELAKSLNIPYAKLTTWFESRRAQDIKGLYLSITNIISHLQNKQFALKFEFRRNASKFRIFV